MTMKTTKLKGFAKWLSIALAAAMAFAASVSSHASQEVIDLINSGEANVILMRHALAPGTGDPANFTLGQCETQRNLNDTGRQQAVATGDFLRSHDIEFDKIYTSQWCRCVETAELLQLGQVVELPMINSFFQEMSKSQAQTDELTQWLASQSDESPILLVTHQVNITAYTSVYPRSGELVVGRYDDNGVFTLLGEIEPR